MWSIQVSPDPLSYNHHESNYNYNHHNQESKSNHDLTSTSVIIQATVNILSLITDICTNHCNTNHGTNQDINKDHNHDNLDEILQAFHQGGRIARITFADLLSRQVANHTPYSFITEEIEWFVESLHFMRSQNSSQQRLFGRRNNEKSRSKSKNKNSSKSLCSYYPPYILERTDVYCDETNIYLNFALYTTHHQYKSTRTKDDNQTFTSPLSSIHSFQQPIIHFLNFISRQVINTSTTNTNDSLLSHIATSILQTKIRNEVLPSINAVAFIANHSIMPRKSGVSYLPMSSPPAIPFASPVNSPMTQSITVELGTLFAKYIPLHLLGGDASSESIMNGKIVLTGLVIPRGITLIVGGGYHGKSTMLRTIAAGIYNKILGDGRELCITLSNAATVRSEDGRYVNNTNVSAFITNLPTPSTNTQSFSTREASGSTSQAANVSEAIEMGVKVMLVDEDVSAANFMSRDGRMRALVMDESITPLLYRVNGLFHTHGISSVVVVGGVGDWLDVPNAVVKLDKYVASDALKKAQSISAQFSYGHVEYAGRGVVHRLPWDEDGITPHPRRIVNAATFHDCSVSLLDGGGKIALDPALDQNDDDEMNDCSDSDHGDDNDDNLGMIDMSRCENLLGGTWHLYGCALCVLWILETSKKNPQWGISKLLDSLEDVMNNQSNSHSQYGGCGIYSVVQSLQHSSISVGVNINSNDDSPHSSLLKSVGFAYRPRRYEIFMALTRMRGIKFEELPVEIDHEKLAAKEEEERRKQALADLWASRRKK